MSLRAHGNFQLLIEGRIIHNYPIGGFNADGIMELADEIVAAAPPSGRWALFEHPKSDAGLTPDGIEAIRMMYEILATKGCVAFGMEVGHTFGKILEREVFNELGSPFMVSHDEKKIEAFLLSVLQPPK